MNDETEKWLVITGHQSLLTSSTWYISMVSSQGSKTLLTMKKAGLKVGSTTLQYFKKDQDIFNICIFKYCTFLWKYFEPRILLFWELGSSILPRGVVHPQIGIGYSESINLSMFKFNPSSILTNSKPYVLWNKVEFGQNKKSLNLNTISSVIYFKLSKLDPIRLMLG